MAIFGEDKRCYYEVMGLEKDCSFDEIKKAYKKPALKLHPDKVVNSGFSQEEATSKFQELSDAYYVLLDPWLRKLYDSEQIKKSSKSAKSAKSESETLLKPTTRRPSYIPNLSPFFSRSVFSGYSSDSETSFFRVYSTVFNKVRTTESKFSKIKVDAAPEIGDLNSPYDHVVSFYAYWTSFTTSMDFQWADIFPTQCLDNETNRWFRRKIMAMNGKARRVAQNRYNMMVRNLARVVRRRDKRVIDMAVKREQAKKREREMFQAKKEEEMKRRIEIELAAASQNCIDDDDHDHDHKVLYCLVCQKEYKSDNQWKNHQQSKKHIHNHKLFNFTTITAAC